VGLLPHGLQEFPHLVDLRLENREPVENLRDGLPQSAPILPTGFRAFEPGFVAIAPTPGCEGPKACVLHLDFPLGIPGHRESLASF
jgi:hypothetical protein